MIPTTIEVAAVSPMERLSSVDMSEGRVILPRAVFLAANLVLSPQASLG
jgi:hypothetical protein